MKGTRSPYAALLTKILSPGWIVGHIDGVGTWYWSAIVERASVSTSRIAAKRRAVGASTPIALPARTRTSGRRAGAS